MKHKSRQKWLCMDCGLHTGKAHEHYFVNTDLWMAATGSETGMLCILCLEKRLGRNLTPEDFPKVHINNPKMYPMSDLLRSRIGA